MATQVFLLDTAATTHRGTNTAGLNAAASGWLPKATGTVRGSGVVSKATNTVAGATPGVEVTNGAAATRLEWITPPVDADVTIAGTITGNIWALESANTANTAINFYVEKIAAATGTLTRIATSAFTTELTTGNLARSPTATPTSTAVNKGDRLRICIFGDDAASSMASGQTFTTAYNGTTAAASGDTYLSFTETFGFQTEDPGALITQDVHSASTGNVQGGTGTNEKRAQSFTLAVESELTSAQLYMAKVAAPTDNAVLDVVSSLDGSSLASASVAGSGMSTTQGYVTFTFGSPVTLAAGTYFLQLSRSGARDTTNHYAWSYQASNVYAGGSFWGKASGAWAEGATLDFRFILYGSVDPFTGSTLYLTDTASDVATADVDREAWTSRGGSAANDVTPTTTGWTAPVQVTDAGASLAVQANATSDYTFGESTTNFLRAQSFQSGSSVTCRRVNVNLRKIGAPTDNVTIAIQADSSGSPSGTDLASTTLAASSLATTRADYVVSLSLALTASTTYWLVLGRSGSVDAANYLSWSGDASNVYGSGAPKLRNSAGTWSAGTVGDHAFEILSGEPVSWFTPPLEAFTLSGLVKVNRRAAASSTLARASIGAEIARVDEDGTNATVWGYANRDAATAFAGQIANTETAYTCYVAGDDLAFTDGQRIRIRLFMDDCADVPLVTAHTLTSYYGGPTGGASGDTYLILGQTLTEFSGGGDATVTPATIARSITVPQVIQTTTASVTPATVSRSVTIDQASAGAATSQTPATIARAVTVPQAEARAGVSVTPATIARSVTVPAASPQLGTSVTPVTVARAVSVPQAAGGAFASPTPATIARAVTTPQASPQAGASVTPATVARSATIDQAIPLASSSVTPAVIARTVGIDQATPAGSLDAYETEVTADAPVVWWKANDGSGALEDHGSGADSDIATFGDPVYGEPSLVSVGTNTSVKFNSVGSNDYFRTTMTSELQLTGSFTFEVWFYFEGSNPSLGTIMCERFDDTTDVRYMMGFYDGSTNGLTPNFGWYNGSWRLATGTALSPSTDPYHLVGVYDASGTPAIRLYVNGSLVDTETSIGTQPTGTNDVQLGRRWDSSSNEYMGGTNDAWIQHAAFYGTALSSGRIAAHYAAGAGAVGATVTPATIATTVAVPAVTQQLGASVTPATIARSVTVNAPTVTTGAGASVTPATIARSVAIDQVTRTAGVSVTPATVARSVTIPQTGYAIGASITPATIGRAITVNAPIVTAGGGATRTPDTVATVVAIGQVVAQVGSVITPATIARSVLIPQASPLASSSVTPVTIARSVLVPQVIVTTQVSVTPVTIARSVVIDQVSALLSAVASPAVIARSVLVPQAAIAAGASVTPATVARAVAMGTPTVIAGGDVTLVPDTIARAFSVPQASPQAAASITPATVARALSVPQVAATGASTVTPATIARSVAMGQVIITAAASITPATLARAFVIDQAIGGASKTVSPALIARVFTMPQTTTQVGTDANPVIAVIARAFTIPGTGYVTNWVVSADAIALVVTLEEPDIITKPTLIITRSGPKAPGPASGEVLVTGDGAGTPTPAGDVLVIGG